MNPTHKYLNVSNKNLYNKITIDNWIKNLSKNHRMYILILHFLIQIIIINNSKWIVGTLN